MRTSIGEPLLDLAVSGVLWGFRILLVAAVLIGTIAAVRAGKYTSEQWIDFVVFGISQGSIYALIALGYTMVYGILRMINFAHGDIFMTGAFAAYFLATWLNGTGFIDNNPILGLLIPIVFAMIVAGGSAMLVERIAYRPLRGAPHGFFIMIFKCKCCGFFCDSFLFFFNFDEERVFCLINDESGLVYPGRIGALDDSHHSTNEFVTGDRFAFHRFCPCRTMSVGWLV